MEPNGPESRVITQPRLPKVEIKISFDPNSGQMEVSGPPDKIGMVGLLEVAKATILDNRPADQRRVIPATMG